jgi:hypothetical protein
MPTNLQNCLCALPKSSCAYEIQRVKLKSTCGRKSRIARLTGSTEYKPCFWSKAPFLWINGVSSRYMSGALMIEKPMSPITGKTYISNRLRFFTLVGSLTTLLVESNQARATSLNELASGCPASRRLMVSIFAAFSALICLRLDAGSMPLSICGLDSIIFVLASRKLHCGYTPKASTFSLPSNRYLSLKYFAPLLAIKRYRPFPSVNFIWGYLFWCGLLYPQMPLFFNARLPLMDTKKPAKPCSLRVLVNLCRSLSTRMVPRAGIEPARCHHHRILNPARLPVPPPRQRAAIIGILA